MSGLPIRRTRGYMPAGAGLDSGGSAKIPRGAKGPEARRRLQMSSQRPLEVGDTVATRLCSQQISLLTAEKPR